MQPVGKSTLDRFEALRNVLNAKEANLIIGRHGLSVDSAEQSFISGVDLQVGKKRKFDKMLLQDLQHNPLDLAASGEDYSIKHAHDLQTNAENWRSYHWQIAAHAPVPKRIVAGPLRAAQPIYAVKLDPDTPTTPERPSRSLFRNFLRSPKRQPTSPIPVGLEKVGERFGNVCVFGDQAALQAYAKSRDQLCTDSEIHSEFMSLEDGEVVKYEPLTGGERPSKKKFTLVIAGTGSDFRSSVEPFSHMRKPRDIKNIMRAAQRQGGTVAPDSAKDRTDWAVHKLLQADVPLDSLLADHQVSLCFWNHVSGKYVSRTAPHFQTPKLTLRHELKHVWQAHSNFMRQVEARQSTDAGELTDREELITIREENRVAALHGEAMRYSHGASPFVDMPDSTIAPAFLSEKGFIDIFNRWADALVADRDIDALSVERITNRGILQSNPGLAEYRQEQLRTFKRKRKRTEPC